MPEYLIFANEEWVTETNEEGWRQRSRDVRAVVKEMKAAGVYVFLGGLDNDARVFHVEPGGGTPLFTDGPYTETKEVIGGFAVIDVPDEAAARYWAGRIAVACDWPHEVRIFQKPPAEITSLDAATRPAREAGRHRSEHHLITEWPSDSA